MKTILSIIICLSTCVANAQTWDEWMNQKATQKKYLLQQIAAFEEHLQDIRKGYAVVSSGIQTVKDITNGEFNLHNLFFSSLGTVNPKIKNIAEVADIIAMQLSIVKTFRNAISNNTISSADEVAYIGRVYNTITSACLQDIDMLLAVLTDRVMQLRDEERINRIMAIHASMQDKYDFTKAFTNSSLLLNGQRQQEANEISSLKQLYQLK